jgi:hypothetical protein
MAVAFAYRTGTCSGRLFNTFQLAAASPCVAPTTPALWPVWADPRSLATTSGIVSVPLGTEMFQFPRFAPSKDGDGGSPPPGFPIRPSRAHRVCAAPPGLSQLTTAFIASVCPGIPHMPSLA